MNQFLQLSLTNNSRSLEAIIILTNMPALEEVKALKAYIQIHQGEIISHPGKVNNYNYNYMYICVSVCIYYIYMVSLI